MENTAGIAGQYRRAEVNGIRLYYRRVGEGSPVVLLHGFPETSYAWRKIMPALAERYTVIAPDLRGCGSSNRRPAKRRLSARVTHLYHSNAK